MCRIISTALCNRIQLLKKILSEIPVMSGILQFAGSSPGIKHTCFKFRRELNTPMQQTAIFHGCKKDKFQKKKFLLIFAQNIDCGYTLEPPQ